MITCSGVVLLLGVWGVWGVVWVWVFGWVGVVGRVGEGPGWGGVGWVFGLVSALGLPPLLEASLP